MTRPSSGFRIGVFFVALLGCGGTDKGRPSGTRPDAGAALEPCNGADGYQTQVLVDFEGEPLMFTGYPDPRTAARCDPSVCQASAFFFNYDEAHSNEDPNDPRSCTGPNAKTQGCSCQEPVNPDVLPFTDPQVGSSLWGREIDKGGRCSAPGYALHFQATNIAMCYGMNGRLGWGAGIDVKFLTPAAIDDGAGGAGGTGNGAGGVGEDEPHPPGSNGYDASGWDGIGFWVRKGNPGTKASFIATISDPGTTPPAPGQPGCTEEETAADAKKCDAFGVAVTVTDEWTYVPARFSAMRQKGFGRPSPLGRLDSGNIVKLQFLFSAGDWDIWIDDVAFFREPNAGP